MILTNINKTNGLKKNKNIIAYIKENLLKKNYTPKYLRNPQIDLLFKNKHILNFIPKSNKTLMQIQSQTNFKSQILNSTKRFLSSFENIEKQTKANNTNAFYESNKEQKLTPEQVEINKILKANEDKLSNSVLKLTADEEINDHLNYLRALEVCKFTESNDFTVKSRKMLLNLFRYKEYSVLYNSDFDEEKFIQFLKKLFYLDLDENDLAALEKKYFSIKDNLQIEDMIQLYDALFYYDHKFKNLKNDILEILAKTYLVMTPENNNNLNINLLFSSPNEISKFSLFATEKLIQYTNFDYMPKILNLTQRLNNIQPLPKIIYEIKNNPEVNDKLKQKILNNSGDVLNKFFKNIPKNDVNEILLICLSNSFFYGKLNSEIFDLFIEGLFKNIGNFEIENLLEIFFLVLSVSKNDKKFSSSKEKLVNQLLIVFSTTKQKPIVFLDTHKFYIYLNNCRFNLNTAFASWSNKKQKEIKKMSENEKDLYERFKKIVRLSIDVYPFATKDLNYSEQLLDDLFVVFKNIVKKF